MFYDCTIDATGICIELRVDAAYTSLIMDACYNWRSCGQAYLFECVLKLSSLMKGRKQA